VLKTNTKVLAVARVDGVQVVETNHGVLRAKFLVNCAGVYSDKIAKSDKGARSLSSSTSAAEEEVQIVPFRGEYYELAPSKRHLVSHLIYPVPNPNFPFLGVHFTRMVDGTIHAGPNAVLAFAREGYEKTDVHAAELLETLTFPGFLRLAAKYWRDGAMEMWRSLSQQAFVASLQRLIPEVRYEDVIPVHAGIRAQALRRDGAMVDDFLIREAQGVMHVCNAPSPAATASLEIGKYLVERIAARVG
jgi:(S)-2-hydroxyglutarate dehydrogenase